MVSSLHANTFVPATAALDAALAYRTTAFASVTAALTVSIATASTLYVAALSAVVTAVVAAAPDATRDRPRLGRL
jgi:hypothetical protein